MDEFSTAPLTPADLTSSLIDTPPLTPGGDADTNCASAAGKFDHPVYKKLAVFNGEVNRMTKQQMKETLSKYKLDTRGHKDVLKKRLKNYIRHKHLSSLSHTEKSAEMTHVNNYSHLVVIDFEATCERRAQGEAQPAYWHEIIEFPVVLVDVATRTVIDEFHSYVRPVINPVLSEFCTELTGITQATVDSAPTFPEVLHDMEEWMRGHGIDVDVKGKRKFAVLTDGPWDMSRFMYLQCRASNLPFPRWALQWINIRKAYTGVYKPRGNTHDGRFRVNLTSMLEGLGLPLVGRLHSGIADTRNIASVAVQMLHDGFCLRINERLCADKKDLMPSEHASCGEVNEMNDEIAENSVEIAVTESRSEVGSSMLESTENGSEVIENRSSIAENSTDDIDDTSRVSDNRLNGWPEKPGGKRGDMNREDECERAVVLSVSRFEDNDENDDEFIVFSDSNDADRRAADPAKSSNSLVKGGTSRDRESKSGESWKEHNIGSDSRIEADKNKERKSEINKNRSSNRVTGSTKESSRETATDIESERDTDRNRDKRETEVELIVSDLKKL